MISLYNFIPLTDSASIAGMYIILWNNIVDAINISPFPVPRVAIIEDIVYPMLYPLYPITAYIKGKPITVEPNNHRVIVI